MLVGALYFGGINASAAPAYDSAYTDTVSLESLIKPALLKNTDSAGIYRQLKLAIQYKGLNEGDLTHLFFYNGVVIPPECVNMLYADGYISSYTYKTLLLIPYTLDDFAPVFDPVYYYNNNKDLQAVCAYDPNAMFYHFLLVGQFEGRPASPSFNLGAYKEKNPDLVSVYGSNNAFYYQHYMLFGRFERRKCL